jgi:hypothetical protein
MKLNREKILAVARQNRRLSIDEVIDIAKLGAMFGLSIGVLCWSETLLAIWTQQLKDVPSLEVLDVNRSTQAEWQTYLSSYPYDILVLHGAQTAEQTGELSAEYVESLVDSVSEGLLVWI